MIDPTPAAPWTVTLAWTPGQNGGRVSVMPNRAPVFAVVGLMTAGESTDQVAAEHRITEMQAYVLWRLRCDLTDDDEEGP